MTKAKQKIVTHGPQMSLLDMLVAAREERVATAPGRLNITARLYGAARKAIRNAKKSREIIVEEMSEMTGDQITVAMLNNFTAESHPHRMPPEYIPAFCVSTGDNEMIAIMAEAAGAFMLPGIDALRAEVQKLREEEHKISSQRKRREVFLKEMEK